MTDTEAAQAGPDPHACTSCGMAIDDCDTKLLAEKTPCCGQCAMTDTHDDTPSTFPQRMAARSAGNAEHWAAQVEAEPEPPGTDVVQADGLQAALMAAAEGGAGQGMATVPPPAEFAHLCQMARLLSMSELAPEKLRGKPFDTLLILLTSRDLGIPVTSGLRKISVIEGQPSIDTELQLALVRQRGYGAVLPLAENFTQGPDDNPLRWAGALAVGPNGQPMGPPTIFTWDDAITAGYVDAECVPERHHIRQMRKGDRSWQGCPCKANWRTVPRDMLWWRAAARARRIYFPEATTGMYDADELGGVIDVEGRMVDPSTAPLPDGYTDPAEQRQQAKAQAEQRGDPDELLDLQLRIRALPAEVRDEMRQAWKDNDRIQGRPPYALPQRLVKLAKSMLTGWEASARRADKSWDRDTARRQVQEEAGWHLAGLLHLGLVAGGMKLPADPEPATAAQEPQEAPEPAAGTPAAPEVQEPENDEPGGAGDDAEPEPEPDEPDRDWSGELRDASEKLAKLVIAAAPYVADTIGQAVRGMSWQAVNKALTEAHLSTEGPIDLRRMRLSIHRFMEYEEPF